MADDLHELEQFSAVPVLLQPGVHDQSVKHKGHVTGSEVLTQTSHSWKGLQLKAGVVFKQYNMLLILYKNG